MIECHNWQRYGHAQSRCTASPKCVKCARHYHTGERQRTRQEPVKCANCRGSHTVNHRRCPRYPRVEKALTASTSTPRDVSYASAVRVRAPVRSAVTLASAGPAAGEIHDDAGESDASDVVERSSSNALVKFTSHHPLKIILGRQRRPLPF